MSRGDESYPQELHDGEQALLDERRPVKRSGVPHRTGIGISGGGIRSATFALGLFQSLARRRRGRGYSLLRDLDYLSTVSGGGYFGGFFSSLFVRANANGPDEGWRAVEDRLRPDSREVRYLRENGRYLAPGGLDDLLLGGTVLLRNWVALIAVLVSLLLFGALALECLSLWIEHSPSSSDDHVARAFEVVRDRGLGRGWWLSPWLVIWGALVAATVVPAGWAYWLIYANWPLTEGIRGRPVSPARVMWRIGPFFVQAVLWALAAGMFATGRTGLAVFILWLVSVAFVAKYFAEARAVVIHEEKDPSRPTIRGYLVSTIPSLLAGIMYVFLGLYVGETVQGLEESFEPLSTSGGVWSLIVIGVLASAFVVADWMIQATTGLLIYWFRLSDDTKRGDEETTRPVDHDRYARHAISRWLQFLLVSTAYVLAFAVLHSGARTIYVYMVQDVEWFLGGIASVSWIGATFGRKIVVKLGQGPDGKRPGWLRTAMEYVGGALALVLVLLGVEVAAQSWVYRGEPPVTATPAAYTLVDGDGDLGGLWWRARGGRLSLHEPDGWNAVDTSVRIADWRAQAGWGAVALLLVSLIVGWSRRFLNGSTHLSLYSARLARGFLGASNPRRIVGETQRDEPQKAECADDDSSKVPPAAPDFVATHLLPEDDIDPGTYWATEAPFRDGASGKGPASQSPYQRGAPLHLINVAINETVDGRSQTQQNDRQGLNMALGPCGLSAGVRHHAVFRWNRRAGEEHTTRGTDSVGVYPRSDSKDDYRVFEHTEPQRWWRRFPSERLSIGRWLGISGAAFTTGVGSETNIGRSLLTGLANVRLGHWWRPGVRRKLEPGRILGAIFFWVQQYLFRELFARFPGTSKSLWYLSDGGHFDITGGYELIRRRVPWIIIVDSGADPDYELEGLGKLVRKARLDFGATIEFLERRTTDPYRPTLQEVLRPGRAEDIGTLEELERGGATELSRVHAAVARITYAGVADDEHDKRGWLLYIKPTLNGDEPADVLRYHTQNPSFPQEPTADQFFGEAQWESYRRLGEHIGDRLFQGGEWPLQHELLRQGK